MENEMITFVTPPMLEGSSSSMVVAPPLLQYQLSNGVIRKTKQWMMKQMLEGDGMLLLLLTSLTYMKRSEGILTNLVCHSNIGHTFALNIVINYRMSVIRKKNKSRLKLKRYKVNTNVKKLCQKNKLEVVDQHGHGLHK
jgi:hypothetical protein